MGLNVAQGAVVPLVGRHLLPRVTEGRLLEKYPGMFGVVPGSEQEGQEHHLTKRAPARYGYRGYRRGYRGRGGGGGNRTRNKVSLIS